MKQICTGNSTEYYIFFQKRFQQLVKIQITQKMKRSLLILVLVSIALSDTILTQNGMNINLAKTYTVDGQRESYTLSVDGANGQVSYSIEGLPAGTYLDGNKIIVGNTTQSGNYILRISATDSQGRVAQRIVNLGIIVTASVNTSSSVVSNNGGATSNNVNNNGAVNTVNTGTISNTNTYGNYDNTNTNTNTNIYNNGNNLQGTSNLYPNGISSVTTTTVNGGTNSNDGYLNFPNGIPTPNNNNPTTSSTTSSSTTTVNRQSLDQLISTYSTITDAPNINYQGGTYPIGNFPTGSDQTLINTTPILIQTTQTVPNDGNRNTITADDVQLRAASQRHQTSIKAITNLLAIIDQARANQKQAQTLINQYNSSYLQTITNQRNIQSQIYAIQIKISQISSAINNINTQITQLNTQAGQNTAQRVQLVQQVVQLQSQIQPYNTQKQQITNTINNYNGQLKPLQDQLNNNKNNCNTINIEINKNTQQLTVLQTKYTNIDSTITNNINIYNSKQETVKDLQNKLNIAIMQRDKAKADLDRVRQQKDSIPSQISLINQRIQQNKIQINSCNSTSNTLQANIDNINNNIVKLTSQLSTISNTISSLQIQINTITTKITQYDNTTGGLNGQVGDLTNQLNFLKTQYTQIDTKRRTLYQNGNDVNNQVHIAKQNLDAVINRYRVQTNNVNTGTANLEKARAEQALARLALEELIQKYTNALPYAIVPNGNGQTNAGTPAGNNPSGSPLGPIQNNGNGAAGVYQISSWTNYLSQAYGAGVNPAFTGSVTALYPFSFSSVVRGNNVYNGVSNTNIGNGNNNNNGGNTGNCYSNISNSPTMSLTGSISQISDTSFDLQTSDGSVYTINVVPCTTLNSNKSSYKIKSGDSAVVKGYRRSNDQLISQSVTCLA